jgi:hypothetical protein
VPGGRLVPSVSGTIMVLPLPYSRTTHSILGRSKGPNARSCAVPSEGLFRRAFSKSSNKISANYSILQCIIQGLKTQFGALFRLVSNRLDADAQWSIRFLWHFNCASTHLCVFLLFYLRVCHNGSAEQLRTLVAPSTIEGRSSSLTL